jgi:hypothetical protein
MLMAVKDFFAPTRGRILLFLIIFLLVFVYDTAFAPFPGSPIVDNLATQDGAMSFVIYILVIPYILSSLIPAFFGLRKKKFIRLTNLKEFFSPRPVYHEQKPSRQQTFTFPTGTTVVESKLPLKTPGQPEAAKPQQKTKPTGKTSKKPKKR